jgi:hypothetical protein
MNGAGAGLGGGGNAGGEELPNAAFSVKEVPRHYLIAATLTFDGMFGLVIGLRRLVDEYDVPECELLLQACYEACPNADWPTAPSIPIEADDDEPAA